MSKQKGQLTLLLVTIVACLVAIFSLRYLLISLDISTNLLVYPAFLFLALFLFLLQEALNPVFAGLALQSVGASTRYLTQLLITLFATSANSTVPIPAGVPVRAVLQKRLLSIPYGVSASAFVIELVIGYGITVIAAILTSLVWLRSPVEPVLNRLSSQINYLMFAVGLTLAVAGLSFVLIKYLVQKQVVKRLELAIELLRHAKLLPVLAMISISFFSIVLATGRFQALLYAMDVSALWGPLMAALLLSRIVGVLSFVPMGLGIRDASLASLLVLIGVPLPFAIAGATLDRLVMTLPYLVGGIWATHTLGKQFLLD